MVCLNSNTYREKTSNFNTGYGKFRFSKSRNNSCLQKSNTHYYSQDGLGSVRTLTNSAGTLVNRYGYTAFGEKFAAGTVENVSNRYAYTGREKTSNADMMYYRWRMYDLSFGLFVQKDPIGYDGGIGLYAYVYNNPIMLNDPLGLLPKCRDCNAERQTSYDSAVLRRTHCIKTGQDAVYKRFAPRIKILKDSLAWWKAEKTAAIAREVDLGYFKVVKGANSYSRAQVNGVIDMRERNISLEVLDRRNAYKQSNDACHDDFNDFVNNKIPHYWRLCNMAVMEDIKNCKCME